ncbi:Putative DUF3857 domain-containing protein [Candidatus Trichorickettsia mobilis]|uniref:DUF3857 domain-containing protein n=1 Tax=Candidatus Trichorickettsia mobilis TaxID=1346319 RepID=A0ABZ0UTF8_9RICK|nr:hypothetical protein [Candidatus Trichorickettsia mobilis]WPY01325.1 Putative DUF3857 domain-containing protein [Candidatus Trichorickettsia mobilis]
MFLSTLKSASQKKDLSEQINEITTELHAKIKHFSDLRSIEGKFIPRNLALVEADQFGDCKDFALIFTKILRSLGYEANIALVRIEDSPSIEKKNSKYV